ncbi:hypothetical protein ACIQVL_20815 [Streptomyces sp. NPDC090499]|uniref:hypothetical protein n=1 Tax=Streptomyces sp. NPDC090499 TaxID=3365965 RepID=UPI0037F43371
MVERTLVRSAEDAEGRPFDVRVQRSLVAAGTVLGRVGAAQLATGRGGGAVRRRHVEQRVDAVIYRRIDELFQGRSPTGTAVGAARAAR